MKPYIYIYIWNQYNLGNVLVLPGYLLCVLGLVLGLGLGLGLGLTECAFWMYY